MNPALRALGIAPGLPSKFVNKTPLNHSNFKVYFILFKLRVLDRLPLPFLVILSHHKHFRFYCRRLVNSMVDDFVYS